MAAYFIVFIAFCAVLSTMAVTSGAEEEGKDVPPMRDHILLQDMQDVDKRYVAALAKNGRLPKFASAQKKGKQYPENLQNAESNFQADLSDEVPNDLWQEDKRHVGAFLKSHGKPSFTKMTRDGDHARYDRSMPLESSEGSLATDNVEGSSSWENTVKRNVASLARLGRLNAIRYGYFQPHYVSGKRLNSNELNDGVSKNDEDNQIDVVNDADCDDDDNVDVKSVEDDFEGDDGDARPNWIQKKRYVAALARSGRLPVWHSQRMWWGGKRDTPTAYWLRSRTGARGNEGKRENSIVETGFPKPKNKRCKKLSRGDYPGGAADKRNLAMLARNGKLPYRP